MSTKKPPDAKTVMKVLVVLAILGVAGLVLINNAKAAEHRQHVHGKYTVGVGAGASNSEGSGVVHISSLQDRFKLFALIWTDNNDDGDQFVVQERKTRPKSANILPLQGDDSNTANVAVGAAYLWNYKMFSAGLGAAYVADDNTDNIGQHFQVYIEGSVKTPKKWWAQRLSVWHLSDADSKGSGETFVGFEKDI